MFGLLWAHNALLSGELPGRAASMEGGTLYLKATAEGDALELKSVLPSRGDRGLLQPVMACCWRMESPRHAALSM